MSDSAPAACRLPRSPEAALHLLSECRDLRPMTDIEVGDFDAVESPDPRIGSVGGLTVVVDGPRVDFYDARSTTWTNVDWSCFRLASALASVVLPIVASAVLLVALAGPASAHGSHSNSAGLRSGGSHSGSSHRTHVRSY